VRFAPPTVIKIASAAMICFRLRKVRGVITRALTVQTGAGLACHCGRRLGTLIRSLDFPSTDEPTQPRFVIAVTESDDRVGA
jgi:hypothetical protein